MLGAELPLPFYKGTLVVLTALALGPVPLLEIFVSQCQASPEQLPVVVSGSRPAVGAGRTCSLTLVRRPPGW